MGLLIRRHRDRFSAGPGGEGVDESPEDLKGRALDEALEAAGLPKTGRADEKRQRLVEHQERQDLIASLDDKPLEDLVTLAGEHEISLDDVEDAENRDQVLTAVRDGLSQA